MDVEAGKKDRKQWLSTSALPINMIPDCKDHFGPKHHVKSVLHKLTSEIMQEFSEAF